MADIIMDILDLAFYYLIRSLKQYADHFPHSATVHIRCKLLNMESSGFISIRIDKGKDGSSIHPQLENLNASFSVLRSTLTSNKDFCSIDPRLYDENYRVIFELRKLIIFWQNLLSQSNGLCSIMVIMIKFRS